MAGAKVKGQVGMDETVLDDKELERALEEREEWRGRAQEVGKTYREKHQAAQGLIAARIEEEAVVRVGRFRIEREPQESQHVEYDTKPTVATRIKTDGK